MSLSLLLQNIKQTFTEQTLLLQFLLIMTKWPKNKYQDLFYLNINLSVLIGPRAPTALLIASDLKFPVPEVPLLNNNL